jgi:hypothetical protein
LRTKILANDSVLNSLINEEGNLGEFEIYEPNFDYTGKWVRGYFIPPKTGNYKFRLSAYQMARLYINKNPNSLNRTDGGLV